MTDYFPTSETTNSGDLLDMTNPGDFVYVAPQVVLIDTNSDDFGIRASSYADAEIFGSVTSFDPLIFVGAAGQTSNIQIGQTGVLSAYAGNGQAGQAIWVTSGSYDISNSGQIIANAGGTGIFVEGGGTIRNYGTIDATTGITNNSDGDVTYLDNYGTIGASATAVSDNYGHTAFVNNYGAIVSGGGGDAVVASAATTETLINVGSITGGVDLGGNGSSVTNQGTIAGIENNAVSLGGAEASLTNAGTIDGEVLLSGTNDSILNTGVINGDVDFFGATGASLDSAHGAITGEVLCDNGGATVIAGETGGAVIGGSGNDKLQASPTLAAANDAAETTLDGRGGNNWLVGDGGYVTFDSGDGDGGINHIDGRLSRMSDVAGDENNTLNYATLTGGAQDVYVDLLTGQAWTCSTANANTGTSGDFTFEDYIRNVPNVIGSSGADVIVCDNGVDNVTGGGGADTLYAGVGAASQDTFTYTAMTDSTQAAEDVIHGFKTGVDKLDFSALNITDANILITQPANHHFSNVFVEQTPGVFNASTNLAISVRTTTAGALTASSIIF